MSIHSDVAPTNSFPRNTTITTLSSQWDIELFSDTWAKWIGEDGAQLLQATSGCYSRVHPGTNLKIISLNTGFWYKAVGQRKKQKTPISTHLKKHYFLTPSS
jgi:sphingomyelin phosphodiesterase